MTTTGAQAMKSGYYLNTSTWAIAPVASDGDRLPAGPGAWRRVPVLAALVAAPVLGLAFLVFLPLIGFALFAVAIGRRITGHAAGGASELAATVAPDLATGAAYLTGEKRDEAAEEPAPELDELEKEIREKRG